MKIWKNTLKLRLIESRLIKSGCVRVLVGLACEKSKTSMNKIFVTELLGRREIGPLLQERKQISRSQSIYIPARGLFSFIHFDLGIPGGVYNNLVCDNMSQSDTHSKSALTSATKTTKT